MEVSLYKLVCVGHIHEIPSQEFGRSPPLFSFEFVVFAKGPAYRVSGPEFGRNVSRLPLVVCEKR